MTRQQTLARKAVAQGVGLHTGAPIALTLQPADEGTGIVFRRTDLAVPVEIPGRVSSVVDTRLATMLGKDGVTPAFVAELERQFGAHELVKLRFTGGQDRHERAALCMAVEQAAPSLCVGTVGHTALFWRPKAGDSPVGG